MKPNTLLSQYKEFMLDIQSPIDYFLAVLIHILVLAATTGIGRIFYELITNPNTFNNTWGVADTLG